MQVQVGSDVGSRKGKEVEDLTRGRPVPPAAEGLGREKRVFKVARSNLLARGLDRQALDCQGCSLEPFCWGAWSSGAWSSRVLAPSCPAGGLVRQALDACALAGIFLLDGLVVRCPVVKDACSLPGLVVKRLVVMGGCSDPLPGGLGRQAPGCQECSL